MQLHQLLAGQFESRPEVVDLKIHTHCCLNIQYFHLSALHFDYTDQERIDNFLTVRLNQIHTLT